MRIRCLKIWQNCQLDAHPCRIDTLKETSWAIILEEFGLKGLGTGGRHLCTVSSPIDLNRVPEDKFREFMGAIAPTVMTDLETKSQGSALDF